MRAHKSVEFSSALNDGEGDGAGAGVGEDRGDGDGEAKTSGLATQ